jgi:hypothetical protein
MSNFVNLNEAIESMSTDPSTAAQPIKRMGDEVRRVGPWDLIFIPRNTIHGPIIEPGQRCAALSVFAPFFDRSKPNINWERDEA